MVTMSLPTRERGLKFCEEAFGTTGTLVAPHAGAWIEISSGTMVIDTESVAPHAGAWIEILSALPGNGCLAGSLPTRERGLK